MSEHENLSKVTRADRAVRDDGWIKELLHRAAAGALATAAPVEETGGPQPFLSTLLFVYDSERHAIYLHTARRGRVWENLRANPRVCFSAFQMGRLLPAGQALNFSVEYASVVVFGKAILVEDAGEAEQALQQMLDKYFSHLKPGADYRPITVEERDATAVYRLDIEEWSGKKKEVGADFLGAFTWPPPQG